MDKFNIKSKIINYNMKEKIEINLEYFYLLLN